MTRKTFFSFITLCLISAIISQSASGGLIQIIRGCVDQVDISDIRNPKIIVQVLPKTSDEIRKITLNVPLTAGPKGCIDWSDPKNRAKAFVLSLVPGNVIRAETSPGEVASGGFQVKTLEFIARASDTLFPGQEKIRDAALLKAFHSPEPKVPVIVLLTGHEELRQQIADPKNRDKARAVIKRLQTDVVKSLPEGAFEPGLMLENVPSLSGQISLSGIRTLAAHPLVSVIEADPLMEFHTPEK